MSSSSDDDYSAHQERPTEFSSQNFVQPSFSFPDASDYNTFLRCQSYHAATAAKEQYNHAIASVNLQYQNSQATSVANLLQQVPGHQPFDISQKNRATASEMFSNHNLNNDKDKDNVNNNNSNNNNNNNSRYPRASRSSAKVVSRQTSLKKFFPATGGPPPQSSNSTLSKQTMSSPNHHDNGNAVAGNDDGINDDDVCNENDYDGNDHHGAGDTPPVDASIDSTWPNGTITFTVPTENLSNSKTPYFGYALCHYTTSTSQKGEVSRRQYCLGVYKCLAASDCPFLQRPMQPASKKLGAPPKPPKYTCPQHPDHDLMWIPCTGGDPAASKKKLSSYPCTIVTCTESPTSINQVSQKVVVYHSGVHNHPRPPITKPAPMGMKEFREMIESNPDLGPTKLKHGRAGRPSVTSLDDSFINRGRVKYYREKILGTRTSKASSTSKPHGIRGGLGSLLQFSKDVPESFFEKVEIAKSDEMIITVQSPYMKKVLNEATSGLQSDTVEGVITDLDYRGHVDIHFTSGYDRYLRRWVPVLISLIFGRTKKHFKSHWKSLFESYDSGVNESWETFTDVFPGVTLDWSDALGIAFIEALEDHALNILGNFDLKRSDIYAFTRKCDVHFKRNMTRVLRNGNVVHPDKEEDFRQLVATMTSDDSSMSKFRRACARLVKQFPKARNWIKWYLHPDRAQSFFPACQVFNEDQQLRFDKLHKTTNAQENLGGQFQDAYGRKMSVNEAILNSWLFSNRFCSDRAGALSGLSPDYAQYPRRPNHRKRKNAPNDGRAPDTNRTLGTTKKKRQTTPKKSKRNQDGKKRHIERSSSLSQQKEVVGGIDNFEGRYTGPGWGVDDPSGNKRITNTCALDSKLVLLIVPYLAKQLRSPYPEYADKSSLLRRTFDLLHNPDLARIYWVRELWNKPVEIGNAVVDIFGTTERFSSRYCLRKNQIHPLALSFEMHYSQTRTCVRQGGCRCSNPSLSPNDVLDHSSDEEVEINTGGVRRVVRHKTTMNFMYLESANPSRSLDKYLGMHPLPNCPNKYLDKETKSYKHCEGPTVWEKAEILHWPHTVVFIAQGSEKTLADLPHFFTYRDKKLILRGALLQGGLHFTAVMRADLAWMHYDGITGNDMPPRFRFYPLTKDGAVQAMQGRTLNSVTYEVVDINEPTTTPEEEEMDWSLLFATENSYTSPHHALFERCGSAGEDNHSDDDSNNSEGTEELYRQIAVVVAENKKLKEKKKVHQKQQQISQLSIPDQLKALSQEIAPNKRASTSSKTRSPSKRIPPGFSIRNYVPTCGQKPTCRGCGKTITYTESCIRYKYKGEAGHKFTTTDQYHCQARCLLLMPHQHLKQFLKTKSHVATVLQVKKQIEIVSKK